MQLLLSVRTPTKYNPTFSRDIPSSCLRMRSNVEVFNYTPRLEISTKFDPTSSRGFPSPLVGVNALGVLRVATFRLLVS